MRIHPTHLFLIFLQMFHVQPVWVCQLLSAACAALAAWIACLLFHVPVPVTWAVCSAVTVWGWIQGWFGKRKKGGGGQQGKDATECGEDPQQCKRRSKGHAKGAPGCATKCVLCGEMGTYPGDMKAVMKFDTLHGWCVRWRDLPSELLQTVQQRRAQEYATRFLDLTQSQEHAPRHMSDDSGDDCDPSTGPVPGTVYHTHPTCRQLVAHKGDFAAADASVTRELEARASEEKACAVMDTSEAQRVLRSAHPTSEDNRPHCIICEKDSRSESINRVELDNAADSLIGAAQRILGAPDHATTEEMRAAALRVVTVQGDLFAADTMTHPSCRRRFRTVGYCLPAINEEDDDDTSTHAVDMAKDAALDAVCAWLKKQFQTRKHHSVKLSECVEMYEASGAHAPVRAFARLRDSIAARYNAGLAPDDADRVQVQGNTSHPKGGYFFCTAAAVEGSAAIMHAQRSELDDSAEFAEVEEGFHPPALTDAAVLHRAAQIIRTHLGTIPKQTGPNSAGCGLDRAEAMRCMGGPLLSDFLYDIITPPAKGDHIERAIGSDRDNRCISLAADLALAATGALQPKHLAVSFSLRNRSGCDAADLMAAFGNSATARVGREVRNGTVPCKPMV